MAKIQVMIAASIDGFLPVEDDVRLDWLRRDRRGFKRWYRADVCKLYAGYPLVDLICEKEQADNRTTYLAEISGKEQLELLRGLFLYHIVDEIILYQFPVTRQDGIRILDGFTAAEWKAAQVRRYGNGICRTVYRKVSR